MRTKAICEECKRKLSKHSLVKERGRLLCNYCRQGFNAPSKNKK